MEKQINPVAIVYNRTYGITDFLFYQKLNFFERIKMGCRKINNQNLNAITARTSEDFIKLLKKTTLYKTGQNEFDFQCASVDIIKNTHFQVSFRGLLDLFINDSDIKSFDERNEFIKQCNQIKEIKTSIIKYHLEETENSERD